MEIRQYIPHTAQEVDFAKEVLKARPWRMARRIVSVPAFASSFILLGRSNYLSDNILTTPDLKGQAYITLGALALWGVLQLGSQAHHIYEARLRKRVEKQHPGNPLVYASKLAKNARNCAGPFNLIFPLGLAVDWIAAVQNGHAYREAKRQLATVAQHQ